MVKSWLGGRAGTWKVGTPNLKLQRSNRASAALLTSAPNQPMSAHATCSPLIGRMAAAQESLLDAQPRVTSSADEASPTGGGCSPAPLDVPELAATLLEVAATLRGSRQVRLVSVKSSVARGSILKPDRALTCEHVTEHVTELICKS